MFSFLTLSVAKKKTKQTNEFFIKKQTTLKTELSKTFRI